jgi:hypothetical protein
MSGNWNSAQAFAEANDELGLPQFQAADSFYLVQNGIITQGGKATAPGSGNFDLPFPAPFSQQILTIQVHRIDVANHIYVASVGTTLDNLRVHLTGSGGAFYWFAMGV